MKPFDYVLLAISLALTSISAWFVFASPQTLAQVEIQTDDGTFLYPLDRDQIVSVSGPQGSSHVQISGKKVWVLDSPCTNQVCVQMGVVSHSGQWVACLPNHIFVKIVGKTEGGEELDAQLY